MNQNIIKIATSIQNAINYINNYEQNNKPVLNNKINECFEYLKEINTILEYEIKTNIKTEIEANIPITAPVQPVQPLQPQPQHPLLAVLARSIRDQSLRPTAIVPLMAEHLLPSVPILRPTAIKAPIL